MTQLNSNPRNGRNGHHQNHDLAEDSQILMSTKTQVKRGNNNFDSQFDQQVVLRQSPIWSRAIMISLMGVACFGIGWACLAKIEQVVPAVGQLKPEAAVKEVQAPINGVVKAVYIKDGQAVKPGDLLLTFESVATLAELNSLNKIRNALIKENEIYRKLMSVSQGTASELEFLTSKLPPDIAFLLKSRSSLVAGNQLLRSQLGNQVIMPGVGIDEEELLAVTKKELDSRSKAADLEVEKTRKQLAQTQVKLNDTKNSLAIQTKILNKIKTIAEEGGISQIQYLNQQQEVQNKIAEVAQLQEEEKRLKFDIEKRKEELTNTVASSDKTILEKIGSNKQRIAEIDSQFMRIILDNEQKLAETNSKISQTQLNVKYQELRAPVSGTIFDLQAKNPGFVANYNQKLLQIVPVDNLIAEVLILFNILVLSGKE